MAITVNLWSNENGEIKRFLEKYYEKEVRMDEDVWKWIYIYNKPLDAIDMISVVMDNIDKYKLSMCIQVDDGDLHPVTMENHNDIIKGILYLFYQEIPETAC
ncbi:MAG: hypothetical protein N3B21_15440 [Clostridia bacterium]|nr:hypothetical protein [Clostridia bacterium]